MTKQEIYLATLACHVSEMIRSQAFSELAFRDEEGLRHLARSEFEDALAGTSLALHQRQRSPILNLVLLPEALPPEFLMASVVPAICWPRAASRDNKRPRVFASSSDIYFRSHWVWSHDLDVMIASATAPTGSAGVGELGLITRLLTLPSIEHPAAFGRGYRARRD